MGTCSGISALLRDTRNLAGFLCHVRTPGEGSCLPPRRELARETDQPATLILGFQSLDLWGDRILFLSPSICGILLGQLELRHWVWLMQEAERRR